MCVIGLAAGHVAFKDEGGITAVDFNVGKSNRSEIKVTGKRKRVLILFNLLKKTKFWFAAAMKDCSHVKINSSIG